MAGLAAVLMILNWSYLATGGQSLGLAIFASGAVIIWPILVIALYWQSRRGAVTVDAEGLTVRRSFGLRVRMRWGDIEGVRVVTLRNQGAYTSLKAKISGVDADRRVVAIKLHRPLRPSLIPTVWATGAKRFPPGVRSLTLDVESPGELVQAASRWIG
jgi:hypothetical protein